MAGGMTSGDALQPDATGAGSITIGGDLTVRRMGFGAMQLTGEHILGPAGDPEECRRVLRRAIELGVKLIDTADSYGPGVSEELIAETLFPYPDDLVIATKGGLLRTPDGGWPPDGRPEHLREACEGSLRRLRLDRIDVYQLHRPDPRVPLADSLGTLAELRDEGKIRHVGLSNVSVAQLREAQAIVPIVSVQNLYNVADRRSEDVLEACGADGLAFFPWYPLGGNGELGSPGGPLAQVATRLAATPAQVALAWLLHHSPVMVPIPGTSKVAHLEQNVAAASIELNAGTMSEVEAAAADR
jgi:aryl-alcohol dehydrogenase-like predicted oxidoreductase